MDIFGFKLHTSFLIKENRILAYSIHYSKEKSKDHLIKIKRFHNLEGEIIYDKELERKLQNEIINFMGKNKQSIFQLKDLNRYKYKEVYFFLTNMGKRLCTYSEISKKVGYNIFQVIKALVYNPFIVLVPCHRVIRKDGKLSGYTPLGKEFKKKLLEIEGLL